MQCRFSGIARCGSFPFHVLSLYTRGAVLRFFYPRALVDRSLGAPARCLKISVVITSARQCGSRGARSVIFDNLRHDLGRCVFLRSFGSLDLPF